ncbi:MAG: hypothetical protein K6F92_01930 [Lachnospiraceae bacterium]|nr:hypothetical protein [Lachnospiraceae bacterium]
MNDRRRWYAAMTVIICVLSGLMAVYVLIAITEYKIYDIHSEAIAYIACNVSDAGKDFDGDFDKFLRDISEDMSASGKYSFCGDIVDIENRCVYELSSLMDGASEECIEKHNLYYLPYGLIDIDTPVSFCGFRDEIFYCQQFGFFNTYMPLYGRFPNQTYSYRLFFEMHPAQLLFAESWPFYIVYIVFIVLLEIVIIKVRRRFKPGERSDVIPSTVITMGISDALNAPLEAMREKLEIRASTDGGTCPELKDSVSGEIEHAESLLREFEMAADTVEVYYKHQPVNLYNLACEVYNLHKYMIKDGKPAVSVTADNLEKCFVLGDEGLLGTAVGNLLSSAVKGAKSEVKIEINALERSVRFSVLSDGETTDSQEDAMTKTILGAHGAKYSYDLVDGMNIFCFEMKPSYIISAGGDSDDQE